jgi:hypothetical protein
MGRYAECDPGAIHVTKVSPERTVALSDRSGWICHTGSSGRCAATGTLL